MNDLFDYLDDLVDAGRNRMRANLQISHETESVLSALNAEVILATERAIRAIVTGDLESAHEVAEAKPKINQLAAEAEKHLCKRLTADAPHRLAMFRLESEIMEYLKRMYYFAKRIAKLTSEQDSDSPGETEESDEPDAQVIV